MKLSIRRIMMVFVATFLWMSMMADNHFVVTLIDDYHLEYTLPEGVEPEVPLVVYDADGNGTTKYAFSDIKSIELKESGKTVNGVKRWEVRCVGTPSLVLGVNHTERRLIGIVAENEMGKVFRWSLKENEPVWYGVMPAGSEKVYPFIQDGKVWLRDMGITLRKTNKSFVKAVKKYYVKCGQKMAEDRQLQLKKNPQEILNHGR